MLSYENNRKDGTGTGKRENMHWWHMVQSDEAG